MILNYIVFYKALVERCCRISSVKADI